METYYALTQLPNGGSTLDGQMPQRLKKRQGQQRRYFVRAFTTTAAT